MYKIGDQITFNCTNTIQQFIPTPEIKKIKIECWGASGNHTSSSFEVSYNRFYGKGGYTSGNLLVKPTDILNIYVGGINGYNGGGSADGTYGANGGGATDVRLNGTTLSNRIIVAGGGGGEGTNNHGGPAGGLSGSQGGAAAIATQTTGYSLGLGQNGPYRTSGGGGGYYGGYAGSATYNGGGGGSSYYGTLENGTTTAGVVNNTNGKCIITILELKEFKFLIQDNNQMKSSDGNTINSSMNLPYTESNFNTYGMSDLSKINSNIIINLIDGKYKIAMYKKK